MRLPSLLVAGLFSACVPLFAQSPAQLKAELRTKETAAKKDAEALFAVGKWAAEKSLTAEAKRIYQEVLKMKPDHAGAHEALGNELVDGKWMSAKEAAAVRKAAMDAEFKAKGLIEVNGVWVEKEEAADAKRGVFHHEGQLVTKEEKLALVAGKVRHPDTGDLIDAKNLEKAQNHLYPIGNDGRWVEIKEADQYHSDAGHPWVVRSHSCILVSTLPLSILDEAKVLADQGYDAVAPLLSNMHPTPANRPVVIVAATTEEVRELGNQLGDASSAYGAFLAAPDREATIPGLGKCRPAVAHWEQTVKFAPYYVRHAVGLAYVTGLCADMGADVPDWFAQGFGSLASRFQNGRDAGYFGEQHIQKGGLLPLKGWFSSFAISGDLDPKTISAHVYQAGLLLYYAKNGGDPKALDALVGITSAFQSGKTKGLDKSIEKLVSHLTSQEDAIRAFLQKLVQDKDK
jgi:hypothetical protein